MYNPRVQRRHTAWRPDTTYVQAPVVSLTHYLYLDADAETPKKLLRSKAVKVKARLKRVNHTNRTTSRCRAPGAGPRAHLDSRTVVLKTLCVRRAYA